MKMVNCFKTLKSTFLSAIVTALGISMLALPCFAGEGVAYNFRGNSGVVAMDPTEMAGIPGFEQANWTTSIGATGSASDLVNSSGVATTIDLAWSAGGQYWNNSYSDDPGDIRLNKGFLDSQTISGSSESTLITVTATEIPYGQYAVIVYCDGKNNSASRVAKITVKDPTGTTTLAGPIFNLDAPGIDHDTHGYLRGTAQTLAEATEGGNYVMFEGLTASEIMIETVGVTNSNPRAPVCGIQIVSTSTKKASGPIPANGAVNIALDQDLAWTAPDDPNIAKTDSYDV